MSVAFNRLSYQELDELESTTTPLVGGGIFVGTGFANVGYAAVTGLCKADQKGYLLVEQSYDNTDWIGQTATTYSANDSMNFRVQINAPYFRVRFINDSTPQGSFKLYIYGSRSSLI